MRESVVRRGALQRGISRLRALFAFSSFNTENTEDLCDLRVEILLATDGTGAPQTDRDAKRRQDTGAPGGDTPAPPVLWPGTFLLAGGAANSSLHIWAYKHVAEGATKERGMDLADGGNQQEIGKRCYFDGTELTIY